MTLRSLAEEYFQKHDLSPRTQSHYRHCVNRWERFTGNPDVQGIDEECLLEFRERCREAVSAATFNSTYNVIRALLNYARQRGMIGDVPFVRRMRERRGVPDMPTLEDLGAAYECADAASWPRGRAGVFWRAFFVLAYFTGLRRNDLIALKWSSVSFDEAVVKVVAAKTGKLHAIPMHPVLRKHLRVLRDESRPPDADRQTADRVLGVGYSLKQIARELGVICEAAGVPKITPQMIRRLSGTQYEKAHGGAGRLILGHALPGASTYYIAVPEVLRVAASRLDYPPQFSICPQERQLVLF